ncbi:unnamed protein product [Discula destructiva]
MRTYSSVLALAALPRAFAAFQQHYAKVPAGYTPLTTTGTSQTTFTIALALSNPEQLEPTLLSVSTPGSAQYGQFLDADDVLALFGPTAAGVAAVTGWLEAGGVTDYVHEGLFINFKADVDTANALLNGSYAYYSHNGLTKLRTLSYTIPEDVEPYVALVDPGIYFGNTKAAIVVPEPGREITNPPPLQGSLAKRQNSTGQTGPTVDPACASILTPACVKALYNVGNYTPSATSGASIGFGSFLNESAIFADLFQFEATYGIPMQNFSTESIDNGTLSQDTSDPYIDSGEANLDVQNIVGVSHPLPVVEFSTGGSPPFIPTPDQPTDADNQNEPYVPYYQYLLSKSNSELPQVISNSYADQEDGVPLDYAIHTCNLIGLAGTRGITVFESSGDGGLGGTCLGPDFTTVEFEPLFPPSCPYVTGVGGTQAVNPEITWTGSGAGFSKYFARPDWQVDAIAEYLKTVSPETLEYYAPYNNNWTGRGIPDIAAHSLTPYYAIVVDGQLHQIGGTSGASPVWAGIVGLLNDARFRAGKSSLGFINPLLYTLGPQGLIDIVEGYVDGCEDNVPGARYNATVGWDPATGNGIPDFQRLKDLVLSI